MRRHTPTDGAHVVVVGAGFGGLAAVRALRGSGAAVTLVDQHAYSTFQPFLYQVATGGLGAGDVAYPARRFARRQLAAFQRGRLAEVADDKIILDDGTVLAYDYLILAAGVTANHFGVPGAAEHSMALYTRRDAVLARDRLITVLEHAGARNTTVLIAGGGPTGVETAGALAELRNSWAAAGILAPGQVRVMLVERGLDLLPQSHPRLRRYALDQLRSRGVDVRLEVAVARVTADTVTLTDETTIAVGCTLWTAGVTAAPHVEAWGLPQGDGGRIRVSDDLRVIGHNQVFVVGDLAVEDARPLPQLAQPAIQTGRHAGRQVRRLLAGRPTRPFRHHDKGTAATIGRGAAIVELPLGLRFTGVAAWLGWLGLHIVMLLGNRNRASSLVNLSWRYFTRPPGAEVVIGDLSDAA